MQTLYERIQAASRPLGRSTLKVDSFLNHQVDPDLMLEIGQEFARRFKDQNPTKILTVETGGIGPAFATAIVMHLPLIIARKRRASGMPRVLLQESTRSQTTGQIVDFFASPEFLTPADRVVIIDDFLTNAQTMLALARLAQKGGAHVVGFGAVIEKTFEKGREILGGLGVPIETLVRVERLEEGVVRFAPPQANP